MSNKEPRKNIKGAGRKLNVPNKYNKNLLERFRNEGFDPAEELKKLFDEAHSQYKKSERAVVEIEKAREENREVKFVGKFDTKNTIKLRSATYLRLAGDLLSEMMKYTYPKLANIEHKVTNETEKVSPVKIYLPDNGRQAPALPEEKLDSEPIEVESKVLDGT